MLPNGDVLVAESNGVPRTVMRNLFDRAMSATMRRAAAVGVSANRITLLRDANKDGVAEIREVFLENLNQPFGMALIGDTFYVGNTDGLMGFPFDAATTRITGPGRRLATFKPGGHWTRSLLVSPDKTKIYIGVGSATNIGDDGMVVEEGRAAIHEYDIATGICRIFASGLRNAVGMAWEPNTGALCKVASAITPDYALGGHTASLGLAWVQEGQLPGFPEGMAIGQHGSWNRSTLSGYAMVFVPFANGKPSGPARDILTGFLAPDESVSYGRPVGVTVAADGALLMADDVGNVIWRVAGAV